MAEILHHFWVDGISLHTLNLNIGGIQMQETDAVMNGWNPAPPSMSSQHWNYGGCRGKHQRCYNAIHGRRCRISAINSSKGTRDSYWYGCNPLPQAPPSFRWNRSTFLDEEFWKRRRIFNTRSWSWSLHDVGGWCWSFVFFSYDGTQALVIFLDLMWFSVETPIGTTSNSDPSPKIENPTLVVSQQNGAVFVFREAVVGVQLSHDGNWVLSQAQDCEIRFAPKFGEELGEVFPKNASHVPKISEVGYDRMFRKIRKLFLLNMVAPSTFVFEELLCVVESILARWA